MSAAPAWLRRARDFVQEHAFTPISLARIAQAAGRHEIHLAREFRRHFGVSVGGYVRQLRTEEAARLLVHSRRDIAGIALACGFSSHAHLCREFKARFGITPSRYRGSQG
jgi:AraC family transcriptional regulator